MLDLSTLLVVNDNSFPYGGGRELASDNTEFLRIRLPVSLIADEREDDKDSWYRPRALASLSPQVRLRD